MVSDETSASRTIGGAVWTDCDKLPANASTLCAATTALSGRSTSPIDTRIIRPAKLAHMVLKTNRYKELIDWYQRVLGAEVVHGDKMATFLKMLLKIRSMQSLYICIDNHKVVTAQVTQSRQQTLDPRNSQLR